VFDRLEQVAARYRELEELLGQPGIAQNPDRLRDLSRELSEIRDTVTTYGEWKELQQALTDNRELLGDDDAEIVELARGEIESLEPQSAEAEERLKRLLLPRDPNDTKNVVLEIRAGTGGDEASLFAGDLFRMYSRYAENIGWKIELLSMASTDAGGIKEVIATISGRDVYGRLKHESGVHRVQRVPTTESQGRIHTSTVTVAVLAEAEDVDVVIDDKDLRVDVYRASGPGGQSVNTTDSAVRITHLPTDLVVTCQDEKSQHKNKARALKILRSRLFDLELRRLQEKRADQRRGQIGSGERSERIRTYNFPQNRVTDHRVGITLHKLGLIMEGELDELFESLEVQLQAEAMAAQEASP
jgi:peptide chain release factor 1